MTSKDYVRAYIQVRIIDAVTSGWTFSTYVLFILSTGHTLLHASLANVVFMLTNFLLDPLTGKWGDKYGYRIIYLSGLGFWALGMATYGISSEFWQFCLAEIFAGIGKSLISESMESWVENSVPRPQAIFAKGRGEARAKQATILSGILGGLIGAAFGLRWPWLIEAALSLVGLFFVWRILRKFPRSKHSFEEVTSMSISNAWRATFANPHLRFITVFSMILAFAVSPFNMFHTVWLEDLSGGQSWWLGFLWIGISLCLAKGSSLTEKITKASRKKFVVLLIAICIPMVLAAVTQWLPIVVLMFFLHEIPRGAERNLAYTFANPHIEDGNRSMMNSVRSASRMFGFAGGLVLFGALSEQLTIPEMWLISCFILIIYAGAIWLSNGGVIVR